MMKPFVVGITGGSGSGKTFILKSILQHFASDEVSVLSQDNYYIPRPDQPKDENGVKNFDLPESIHLTEFQNDIVRIKQGEKLVRKEYTYNNPKRTPSVIETSPAPIIFVEGIFIFSHSFIDEELDFRIFVEAETRIMLERRLHRDFVERGYNADDVNYRYQNHVLPTIKKYIEPFRVKADIIIQNNGSIVPDLGDLVAHLKTKSQ